MRPASDYFAVAFSAVVTVIVYYLFTVPEASLGGLGNLSANSSGDPSAIGLAVAYALCMGFVALMLTVFLTRASRAA